MGFSRLVLVLSAATISIVAQAQTPVDPPISHPELIAGPWETSDASGIYGIFINFNTTYAVFGQITNPQTGQVITTVPNLTLQQLASERITGQSFTVRVYYRRKGEQTSSVSGVSEFSTTLNGQPLRLQFSKGVDLTFSSETQQWIGLWLSNGQSSNVIFERPRPSGGPDSSVFVGDYEGGRLASEKLHIRQSSDGILTIWGDSSNLGTQVNDRLLITSSTPDALTVDPVPDCGTCLNARPFRVTLSQDRQVLAAIEELQDGRPGVGWSYHRIAPATP